MSNLSPEWMRYERLIARMIADQAATDMCVTPNARIIGRITGVRRQIDVLMEARHETDNSRRIIIDAKRRTRKVDVKAVEAFRGMMEDVGATHGYIICPSGYTPAAEKRAQESVSIRIVPLDRLEGFDPANWPHCKRDGCNKGRVFWDGYPELTVALAPAADPEAPPLLDRRVHYVGKCDFCGRFHVLCLTCGDILDLREDDESDIGKRCNCRPPWFWLASIEEDDAGARSAELHVCSHWGMRTVDRRSL